MTAVALVVLTLASWRLFVLVSRDEILDPIRDRLPDRVIETLECPFCTGFWTSGIWVTGYALVFEAGWAWWWGGWWAVAAGVALLETLVEHIE